MTRDQIRAALTFEVQRDVYPIRACRAVEEAPTTRVEVESDGASWLPEEMGYADGLGA